MTTGEPPGQWGPEWQQGDGPGIVHSDYKSGRLDGSARYRPGSRDCRAVHTAHKIWRGRRWRGGKQGKASQSLLPGPAPLPLFLYLRLLDVLGRCGDNLGSIMHSRELLSSIEPFTRFLGCPVQSRVIDFLDNLT
jgi:hypothetical protein